MKHSKLQRKFVNQMRGMGDIPWPARRFKYPPTFGNSARTADTGEQCPRKVDEAQVRQGRFRRKKTIAIACGGRLLVKRGTHGKRRVYCESCRSRREQRKLELRLTRRAQRFGYVPSREAAQERRSTRLLSKFRRSGSR